MFGIKPEVLKDLSGEEKFAIVSYANAYVGLKNVYECIFSNYLMLLLNYVLATPLH